MIERRLDENRPEISNCDDEADPKDSSGNDQNSDEAIENIVSLDQEGGDGGDSDVEGDECVIHSEGMDTSSGINHSKDVELDDGDERGKVKGLVKLTGYGGTHHIGNVIIEGDSQSSVIALDGCRVGERKRDVKIPGPPSD